MVQKEIEVKLKGGLFARAAAHFVQVASRFRSDLFMERNGKSVNAKSIMGVMSLAVASGQKVTIRADGSDETQALEGLARLVESEQL